MASKNYKFVRVTDHEAGRMLTELARADLRSESSMTVWLIRQEYARRFSRPNEGVTIGEAIAASEVTK